MSLGTVDGVVYGGANAVNLKSIVWYQPAEFEKRGYVAVSYTHLTLPTTVRV